MEGDRAEFNPNLELLDDVQVVVSVRQRKTGKSDWKNFNVREIAIAAGDSIGVDLNVVARQLYRGLGAT